MGGLGPAVHTPAPKGACSPHSTPARLCGALLHPPWGLHCPSGQGPREDSPYIVGLISAPGRTSGTPQARPRALGGVLAREPMPEPSPSGCLPRANRRSCWSRTGGTPLPEHGAGWTRGFTVWSRGWSLLGQSSLRHPPSRFPSPEEHTHGPTGSDQRDTRPHREAEQLRRPRGEARPPRPAVHSRPRCGHALPVGIRCVLVDVRDPPSIRLEETRGTQRQPARCAPVLLVLLLPRSSGRRSHPPTGALGVPSADSPPAPSSAHAPYGPTAPPDASPRPSRDPSTCPHPALNPLCSPSKS